MALMYIPKLPKVGNTTLTFQQTENVFYYTYKPKKIQFSSSKERLFPNLRQSLAPLNIDVFADIQL